MAQIPDLITTEDDRRGSNPRPSGLHYAAVHCSGLRIPYTYTVLSFTRCSVLRVIVPPVTSDRTSRCRRDAEEATPRTPACEGWSPEDPDALVVLAVLLPFYRLFDLRLSLLYLLFYLRASPL
jgi:hypothetical protein